VIDDASADWTGAESQVAATAGGRKGLGTIVSVKVTVKKRKPERDDEEQADGKAGGKKSTRRGGKKAKRT